MYLSIYSSVHRFIYPSFCFSHSHSYSHSHSHSHFLLKGSFHLKTSCINLLILLRYQSSFILYRSWMIPKYLSHGFIYNQDPELLCQACVVLYSCILSEQFHLFLTFLQVLLRIFICFQWLSLIFVFTVFPYLFHNYLKYWLVKMIIGRRFVIYLWKKMT